MSSHIPFVFLIRIKNIPCSPLHFSRIMKACLSFFNPLDAPFPFPYELFPDHISFVDAVNEWWKHPQRREPL